MRPSGSNATTPTKPAWPVRGWPRGLALGEHHEQPLRRLVLQPPRDLGFTHFDCAALGEAISTSHADEANAVSMEDHRSGLAAKFVVSRKTLRARSRYQGFANLSNPVCTARARAPSSVWL
jgi:hypothetical protein